MLVRCIWEHNGQDTLLHAENFAGAYTRGATLEEALSKMPKEVNAYLKWLDKPELSAIEIKIVQEKASTLNICDADSDVIFDSEKTPIALNDYLYLKGLCLKSANDFHELYKSIPNKDESILTTRQTFYGAVPRTAREMYEHTQNVNNYYFSEIGVETDNEGNIYECRERSFSKLERKPNFLSTPPIMGSYDEWWSLRKMLRRFIWHHRIHAKAMYRMALKTFDCNIKNTFKF